MGKNQGSLRGASKKQVLLDRGSVPLLELREKHLPDGKLRFVESAPADVWTLPLPADDPTKASSVGNLPLFFHDVFIVASPAELEEMTVRFLEIQHRVEWASLRERLLVAVASSSQTLTKKTLFALAQVNNTQVVKTLRDRPGLPAEVLLTTQVTQVRSYHDDAGADWSHQHHLPTWLLRILCDLYHTVLVSDEEDRDDLWDYLSIHENLPLEERARLTEAHASHNLRLGGWYGRYEADLPGMPLRASVSEQLVRFYPDLADLPHDLRVGALASQPVADPAWNAPIPDRWTERVLAWLPSAEVWEQEQS